jgi:hypothetical protein
MTKTYDIPQYEKAYNILMDYFEFFPEDIKWEIHKKLEEIGL